VLLLMLHGLQVSGQDNFGSLDDHPPAAMRYTSAAWRRPTPSLLSVVAADAAWIAGLRPGQLWVAG
jgi:DNA gyrase/topoisomerase IV subunit A